MTTTWEWPDSGRDSRTPEQEAERVRGILAADPPERLCALCKRWPQEFGVHCLSCANDLADAEEQRRDDV